ncbi:hypothetical protein I3843_09G013300 [Carya illinoinensis]|uniref:Protein BIC1 n=1 Tax=Carya illinoinensis TaxID=32201 RepID=A0A922E050_CARIL|nr:hypothetical protein I3842_09G013500 [Carya illinoinensis]KAG7961395.1 hypothetical protein I3843_09G013300 [Carya illinoinensis]
MDRQDSPVFDRFTPSQPLESKKNYDQSENGSEKDSRGSGNNEKETKISSSSRIRQFDREEAALFAGMSSRPDQDDDGEEKPVVVLSSEAMPEDSGRERLKRHRVEVAGRVWIPDIWGQEELLNDWVDCSAFDASLVPKGIMSARAALVEEGRRANSSGLRIVNRC